MTARPRNRDARWRTDRRPAGPSRVAAAQILRAVREDDAYANLAAASVLREAALEPRDAAMATELAYGTLRQRRWLDAVLAACVDRPLEQVDPPVLDVLRLGAYQLLAMGTAPHAAVAETVQLARQVVGEGSARFVNAVLRRVGERDVESWVDAVAPAPGEDPAGHLAVVRSHPDWMVEALRAALAADGRSGWVELEDLLVADNAPGPVTLVARPGLVSVDELLAADGTAPGRYSPHAVTVAGRPGAIPAVRDGRAGVQDEGSQLVALALARAPVDGSDARWLDLCAGPGGKAALLAAVGAERGARLTAVEKNPRRAELVRAAVRHLDVMVETSDGRDPRWRTGTYDRVLVDAPCSGLGVLARRAESRWRRTPGDVVDLVRPQHELLAAALEAVRPGGLVGYATCSPVLAETSEIVEPVVAQGLAELVPVPPLLPEVPGLSGPELRLWPHVHGTDGMYLALLRRRAG